MLLGGPSGAGKSTILYALAGALGHTIAGEMTGEVRVDGQIGLLMQNPGDSLVAERIGRDVAFGLENRKLPREEMPSRIRASLDAVGLEFDPDHLSAALSGGETQRLALAGVLALEPGLLLLDEPTSMLDDVNARQVRETILGVVDKTGATMIVVEHRIGPWLEHVDRMIVLDSDGGVISDGPPGSLSVQTSEKLAASGVWMPGLPSPEPLRVPERLVLPHVHPLELSARDVSIELRTRTLRGTTTTQALMGIDAELASARTTVFTGPSGAGKSTLLAAFAGLEEPTSGRIAGTQRPLHRWPSPELARAIGWVPQNPENGFLTTSVRDEIAHTATKLDIAVDVDAILVLFGLTHRAGANPFRLSGGEQRRLALAAALAHRPGVVLLDEPTVGQDRHTWAAVTGWMLAAASAGAAVGAATHEGDLIALADTHVVLNDGSVV